MRKVFLSFFTALFLFNTCYSQRDSVHTLFTGSPHIRIPLHYSYLQWDVGYTNFLFDNTSINGYSLDLFGLVFNNDLDIAVGFEGGGGGYGYTSTNSVRSYSSAYIKLEPMLLTENLINFSLPLKLAYSDISVSNGYGGYGGGYGRGRGRGGAGNSFFSFTPGADVYLNVLHFLSIGTGINYRLAFSSPGGYAANDYNNFSFSLMLRFKIYPHKNGGVRQPDYYTPPQQRMQQ